MAHVQMDGGGKVVGVYGGPQPDNGAVADIPDDDPRIAAFLRPVDTAQQAALKQLLANDATMFRALELLIDVLLAKGVIAATDFPVAVRNMYLARKALRTTAGVP